MIIYLVITAIVLVVFVAMNLLPYTPKQPARSRSGMGIDTSIFHDPMNMPDFFKGLRVRGTDGDEMPTGYGEFGHEVTNPIPVHTVYGNAAYLDRLWTSGGIQVEYFRVGSTRAQNIDGLIDKYEIKVGGAPIATLFICPYNMKNSDRAPLGFKLAALPWG